MFPGERGAGDFTPIPLEGSGSVDLSWVAQDDRLKELASAAAETMGVEHLQDLIVKHARFDQPSTIHEADGTSWQSPHYFLELLLKVVPEYMTNAQQAGLTPEQAYSLVHTIVTAEGRSEWSPIDQPVVQLSRAFRCHVERSKVLGKEEYVILHSLVADTARHGDDNTAVIDAYRALTRLGFSSAESNALIRNELYTDSLIINYALKAFNALSIAEVNAELLTEVCRLICGENPQLPNLQAGYIMLTELIATVCPGRDIPPHELLTTVRNHLAAGRNMAEIAESFIASTRQAVASGASLCHPTERRSKHFIVKSGELELSPLPYRSERSFSDGAADIIKIALHQLRYGDMIGEGMWVFDPESSPSVWYSLGGETNIDLERGAARHNYPQYPLGDLSRSPVLFHAHPVAVEAIGPGLNSGICPNIAVPAVRRFLAATPSRRDYAMVADLLRSPEYRGGEVRSFIAHGSGITEYIFPLDPEALEEMSHASQTLRDDVLVGANWEHILFARKLGGLARGRQKDASEVVQDLIHQLNSTMPKGFRLSLSDAAVQVEL